MKKIISVFLALVLLMSLGAPAFAVDPVDPKFTFDLTAVGEYTNPHDIEVETGTTITVLYSLSADTGDGCYALTQDEIYYDTSFFEFVADSVKLEEDVDGVDIGHHQRLDNNWYVFFNNGSSKYFDNDMDYAPIGSFQLKVIAERGSSTVQSTNFGAKTLGNVPYKQENFDLKVTIAGSREDAGVSITAPTAKTYGDSTFTVSASAATPGTGTQTWSWVSADPTVLEIVSGANTATPTIKILKADTSGVKLTAAYSSDTHEGTADATIVVNKATLTPGIDTVADKPYDGTTTGSGTIKLTGAKNGDAPAATGTFTWKAAVAGTNTVDVTNIALTGTWGDKYVLSATDLSDKAAGKSISPKTLTKDDLQYTGNAITKAYDGTTDCTFPEGGKVEVKAASLVGEDTLPITGTAVYNSENVADATKVTFTPTAITSGNYRLAATQKLDINAVITKADQTPNITSTDSLTKGGNTLDLSTLVSSAYGELTFTVLDGTPYGTIGGDGKILTSTDSVGDVKVRVQAAGDDNHNHYDSTTAAITVTVTDKADAGASFNGTVPTTKTYGDAQFTLAGKVTSAGVGVGRWTWTSSNENVLTVDDNGKVTVVGAGEATITAKYESTTTIGTVSAPITVNKAKLTPSINTVADKPYDGTTTGSGTIKLTGAKNGDAPEATGTFTWTAKDAGTNKVNVADIALTGDWGNNYELTATSLTSQNAGKSISPKTLTKDDLEYTGAAITKPYDGNTSCSLTSVSVKTASLIDGDSLTITGKAVYNSANVAEANKVTFTPNAIISGNYRLEATQKLDITGATITKADQTINAGDTQTFTYGDSGKVAATRTKGDGALSYAVQSGSSVSVNASTGELTINGIGNTTVRVTAAETANYKAATKDITVVINPKKLTKPTANNTKFTYNGAPQSYTPAGFNSSTMYISNNTATDAGTHTVSVTPKENYVWTDGTNTAAEISWNIAPAAITSATAASQEYTGSELTPVLTVKAGSLVATYDLGAWSGNLKDIGSYTATVTGKGNFTGSKKVTFEITHEHGSGTLQTGRPAGVGTAGYKDYYKCSCGKFFEEEACTTEITDLTAWKAEGGRGYLAPLFGGNVTIKDGGIVPGAEVTLYQGETSVGTTTTDESGNYHFDEVEKGTYNLVVTKDGKTKTVLVTLDKPESFVKNVELPVSEVNSVVEHSGSVISGDKVRAEETVVGELETIAELETPGSGQKITIKLTVEPEADTATGAQQAIKEKAGTGKEVDFFDLTLTRQVNEDVPENIGNNNNQLLTIVMPFDFTGVEVNSVAVLRYHNDDTGAEPMAKNPGEGEEGFTVNEQEGIITIRAKQFSTYAVSYKEQTSGGHGGSYTPGHTVTSDLSKVIKVTIDGKPVDSKYYTVNGGTVYLTGEFMETLDNGKHTVKLYDGTKVATGIITVTGNPKVESVKTGDAGIAVYGVLALSSVLGMGWIGRKKHDAE